MRGDPAWINPMQSLLISLDSASFSPLLAAVTPYAQEYPFSEWLTNSIFVAVLVCVVVLAFAIKATSKMQLVPGKAQNLMEFIVEFLYTQVEGIVGKHVAPRAFPLLATMFIFILIANWAGLVPGVGTAGWMTDKETKEVFETAGPLTLGHYDGAELKALLRPATADLNMTLGIATCSFILWIWLTLRVSGPVEFLKHTFLPKGVSGGVYWGLLIIFIFVGLIEVVSIAFRPISLSFRLYGNLFAGETLLHTMATMGEVFGMGKALSFIMSVVLPLPFYFLEILVGCLQAMVFSLLSAVYIRLSTSHDDH